MNGVDEVLALPKWTESTGEELANSISHGMGLAGAMIGTPILLLAAFHRAVSRLSYRHDRFYRDDVAAVSRIDALSRLATDACKIHPASAGSLRDFLVNCRNIHAVCAGSASRSLGLDDSGTRLGVGDFGRMS